MKILYPSALLYAALALVPVLGQSSAPANSTTGLPQIMLAPNATGNSAPTAAPSLTPVATPAPKPPARQVRVPADPAEAFAAGVAAYEKNDYTQARDLFAGAEKKAVSPALEFNLGNACYQTADYGAAILHYLRALSLDPRNPDARQNLTLARKGANITTPDTSRLENYSQFFPQNTWAWIASLAGWAALYLAFFPRMYRWRGFTPWLLCATMLAAAVAGGVGLYGARQHAHDGVILHADTTVSVSPTTNSQPAGVLQAGEIVQTIEQHGNYFKIHNNAGLIGWVEATNYSPVWN